MNLLARSGACPCARHRDDETGQIFHSTFAHPLAAKCLNTIAAPRQAPIAWRAALRRQELSVPSETPCGSERLSGWHCERLWDTATRVEITHVLAALFFRGRATSGSHSTLFEAGPGPTLHTDTHTHTLCRLAGAKIGPLTTITAVDLRIRCDGLCLSHCSARGG